MDACFFDRFRGVPGDLGGKALGYPLEIECCGSFQSIGAPEVATECAYKILGPAIKQKAEAMALRSFGSKRGATRETPLP